MNADMIPLIVYLGQLNMEIKIITKRLQVCAAYERESLREELARWKQTQAGVLGKMAFLRVNSTGGAMSVGEIAIFTSLNVFPNVVGIKLAPSVAGSYEQQ